MPWVVRSRLLLIALGIAVSVASCGTGAPAPQGEGEVPVSIPVIVQDDGAVPMAPTINSPGSVDGLVPGGGTATGTAADVAAGVRGREVPQAGDGELSVVSGSVAAPSASRRYLVRISTEGGLDVDGEAFAEFVLATLNHPKGWASEGYGFGRTDDDAAADVTIVLASPDTSAALCRPLITRGKLSCRNGSRVILTWYRWVNGIEEYGSDITGYRQYLVNHEIGHFLGRGHVSCPGPGRPAPVMMQQTISLGECVPNPWP